MILEMDSDSKVYNVGLLIVATLVVAKLISSLIMPRSKKRLPPVVKALPFIGGLAKFLKGPFVMILLVLIPSCFCQANTITAKGSIHHSINMESDDSGSGDQTFTISLAAADALSSNKSSSIHIKVGDALRAKDNDGFALLTNEMDYLNCNSSNPLYLFYGNNASHTLKNPGTFYIISLEADLCNNGAKEMIEVREKGSSTPPPASPYQASFSSSAARSSGPNIPLIVGSAFFAIICVFGGVLCGCWYCC